MLYLNEAKAIRIKKKLTEEEIKKAKLKKRISK